MSQGGGARSLLLPLTPLYRLALVLRELGLRSGLEPVRRLSWPVVSIGNLSTGGAGKTPLTIALARALTRRGLHVDVLSRGYGRRSRLATCVDANGTAEEFGDEPIVIAREAGVPVYVSTQRYQAGLLAERAAASTARIHLLDDGFQHRQLHRDLNILLLNQSDMTDRLLPAGNLRERVGALRRADVLAIPAADAVVLEPALRGRAGFQGPIWRLQRRMETPPIDVAVAAFCGIARPGQFFDGLELAGIRLAARIAFTDHYRYTARDFDRLVSAALAAGAAAFITTEKDRARLGAIAESLSKVLPLETARLKIEIEDEPSCLDWLVKRLMQPAAHGL